MTTPAPGPSPQVLNWLHRVIAPEYADVPRTYADVASTLATFPSLSVRTNVYTHENGHSELLLRIYGTIPVIYRGASYSIPLTFWIPHHYPKQPPIVFVDPPKDMVIQPGNYADPSGKVYHPYLANWVHQSERSNIVDLCDVLRGVFGREPPVRAAHIPQAPEPIVSPPPLPPLPAELSAPRSAPPANTSPSPATGPPPLPPLPRELVRSPTDHPQSARGPQGPPPPPLPPQQHPQPQFATNGFARASPVQQHPREQPALPQQLPLASYRTNVGNPVGPTPQHFHHAPHSPAVASGSFRQPNFGANSLTNIPRSPPPLSAIPPQNRLPSTQSPVRPPSFHAFPQQTPPGMPSSIPAQTRPPPQPKPQPVDIMDLPSPSLEETHSKAAVPPPPPPNPEKDRVVQEIARQLQLRAEAAVQRTRSGLENAAAQREALLRAEANLEREKNELQRTVEICDKDSDILHERIAMAEGVIQDANNREVPPIDAVVVAPTVLHTQLYDLVTEDMAIEDTLYVLGKALDKERISLDVFLKHTRTLAREQFLKRALVKKISEQLGIS